jgi:hypothetical protein
VKKAIPPQAIAQAYRVLSLMDGNDRGRRVAALVLDHFNRATGQCDPSVSRIAKILGMGRATVFRALGEEPLSLLFQRVSHGGHSHRNSYAPDWALFGWVSDAFDAARDGNKPLPMVADVRRSRSHLCDVDGLTGETQTYRINLHNKPTESPRPFTQQPLRFVRVVDGRLGKTTGFAAVSVADRKIADALNKALAGDVDAYGKVLQLATPELYEQAQQAELRRPGSGARMLLEALSEAAR